MRILYFKTIFFLGKWVKIHYRGKKMISLVDKEKQDIFQSVESNEWKSKNNMDERIKKLQSFIKY